jgi:hypothetical protein
MWRSKGERYQVQKAHHLMMINMNFKSPAIREFQSKSINSFNDMKEKWKVLLFGSGQS